MKTNYKLLKLEVEVLTKATTKNIEHIVLDALSTNIDNSNIRAEVVSIQSFRNGKEIDNDNHRTTDNGNNMSQPTKDC